MKGKDPSQEVPTDLKLIGTWNNFSYQLYKKGRGVEQVGGGEEALWT
jgi:hypothetical protein